MKFGWLRTFLLTSQPLFIIIFLIMSNFLLQKIHVTFSLSDPKHIRKSRVFIGKFRGFIQ